MKSTGAVLVEIPDGLRDRYMNSILRHVEALDTGCIIWTGFLDQKGYGRIHLKEKGKRIGAAAHRVSWILTHGAIDDPELVIDHLCRVRNCIRPEHLELVTSPENTRRGFPGGRPSRAPDSDSSGREYCKNGHPWAENSARARVGTSRTAWTCLQCRRDANRRAYYKKIGRPQD